LTTTPKPSVSSIHIERQTLIDVFEDNHSLYQHIAFNICKNTQDAEDALQDAAVNLLTRKLPTGKVNIVQWVARVVTNAALDLLRHKGRRPTAELTEPHESTPAFDSFSTELRDALQQLDSEHRTAIELMDILGLSVVETAWLLNLPVGTVKSRRKRGKDYLQKLLNTNKNL